MLLHKKAHQSVVLEFDQDSLFSTLRHYILTRDLTNCEMSANLSLKSELCCDPTNFEEGSIPSDVLRAPGACENKNTSTNISMVANNRCQSRKLYKSCHGCQVVSEYVHPIPIQRVQQPTGPWQNLAMDFLGTFSL